MGYAIAFVLGAVVTIGAMVVYATKKNGLW
jgi:hypothetical protein